MTDSLDIYAPNRRANINHLFQAALEYVVAGYAIFPLHSVQHGKCTCKNALCEDVAKHPRTRHGLKDATTDPIKVMQWWIEWPHANIAIVTGARSGLVVLDIDPRNGGDLSLRQLEECHGKLPQTLRSRTGGGGWHIFFKHPGGYIKSVSGIAPGIDVKGDGGYIVAPPSLHASGEHYRWED